MTSSLAPTSVYLEKVVLVFEGERDTAEMQQGCKDALKTGGIHFVVRMGNGPIFIEGRRINPLDLERVVPLSGQFVEKDEKRRNTRDGQGRCEATIRDAMFQGH